MVPRPLPKLAVPVAEAESRILDQVEKGKMFKFMNIPDLDALKQARIKRTQWSDFNYDLLSRLFTTGAVAQQINMCGREMSQVSVIPDQRNPFNIDREAVLKFHESINREIAELESIVERLKLVDVSEDPEPSVEAGEQPGGPSKVIIVKGADTASITGYINKLGFESVVINAEANDGWELKLARELAHAGYDVDLNKALK